MQKTYLILAHKNPEQLDRLIDRLSDGESNFYIHLDKSSDIASFSWISESNRNVCFVEDRVECVWGHISLVNATISCMKQAVADGRQGYCILLSGQDYPVKSNKRINRFLEENDGTNYIDISTIETVWPKYVKEICEFYQIHLSKVKGDSVYLPCLFSKDIFTLTAVRNLITCVVRTKSLHPLFQILRRRKLPLGMELYGGSQWWALSMDVVSRIIAFLGNCPQYLKYQSFTSGPDEKFFQTIAMHLAKEGTGIKFGSSLTYANWWRKDCPLPVTFKAPDFNELVQLPDDKLFARKFDDKLDSEILDLIDNKILTSVG